MTAQRGVHYKVGTRIGKRSELNPRFDETGMLRRRWQWGHLRARPYAADYFEVSVALRMEH